MTPKFWVVDDDRYHDDEVSASCILFNAISAQTVVARSKFEGVMVRSYVREPQFTGCLGLRDLFQSCRVSTRLMIITYNM